jgi:type II secretion system protein G
MVAKAAAAANGGPTKHKKNKRPLLEQAPTSADDGLGQSKFARVLASTDYQTREQGLQALVAKPTTGPQAANWKPYLEKLPQDPWGQPYQYLSPGIKGEVDVFSFGADGKSGGSGRDADIGSWQ